MSTAVALNRTFDNGHTSPSGLGRVTNYEQQPVEREPYTAYFNRTGIDAKETLRTWLLERVTSSVIIIIDASRSENPTVAQAPQSPCDQVRFIQASMGLSVSHLADILGVERQTIYNWLQAEDPPALQSRTRTKLADITEIAKQWANRCQFPMGKLSTTLDIGGITFLDLLKQNPRSDQALRNAMDILATRINETQASRHRRIRTTDAKPLSADERILERATSIRFGTTSNKD